MASEKKSNPITSLVDRVKGSKFTSEKSEQLTSEVQKSYGRYINVLAFISKIADLSILTKSKDESLGQASENRCKDCDHSHIHHERHQTDSFIQIHDPVQRQHFHSTCFRNSLPSPCWDCSECYEENQLSTKDNVEHDVMPKHGWVWRISKTINGTTGHLVYQVPEVTDPIRTRDGFAIPWLRYYCDDHLPKMSAAHLKCANRIAIKDLIKEDWWETKSRAHRCNQMIEKFGSKACHVQNENYGYYGFMLDTTEIVTENDVAVLTLFDMAIVETMKIYPEINLNKFNKEVARRIRIWTNDHFFACNNAIANALDIVEAQGFIKHRIHKDKSETLLSDFDNKDCTRNEIVQWHPAVASFAQLERAELDTTSSLHMLQAALNDIGPDIDPYKLARLVQAEENTKMSLNELQAALAEARATLDDLKSDNEGCQDAHAEWRTGLVQFEKNSKPPMETIKTIVAEKDGKHCAVMLEDLQKAVADLRLELDELKARLEACRIHIAGCREYPIPETV